MAVQVLDEAGLLQRAGHHADGRARGAEHHGEKFVAEVEVVNFVDVGE